MRQNIFLLLLLFGSASATLALTSLPMLLPHGPVQAIKRPSR